MRLILPLSLALFVGACASTPKPVERPAAPAPREVGGSGNLIGLTPSELSARLGQPVLQVREGQGTKLQFRSATCVLDAYLYPGPTGNGATRVTHVDTRNRDGANVAPSGCIAALEAR